VTTAEVKGISICHPLGRVIVIAATVKGSSVLTHGGAVTADEVLMRIPLH